MDVTVLGPGAIGVSVAAAAQQADAAVALVGRGARPAPTVAFPGQQPRSLPDVIADPCEPADILFVAVKAHQVDGAAAALRKLTGPQTTVVALQNGVEQREWLRPHCDRRAAILPSVVWFPAEVVDGHIALSEAPRLTLPDEPGAAPVAELLNAGGAAVDLAADFTTLAWRKLAINAVAAVMVLSDRRAEVFTDEHIVRLSRSLAEETVAVARAVGAELSAAAAEEIIDHCRALPPDLGTSMQYDRRAGRTLEWDARNGVVQRLGRAHGIPTPVSDVIVPLLAAISDAAHEAGDGSGGPTRPPSTYARP
jgi:2-dehydropantoate 2-reductase